MQGQTLVQDQTLRWDTLMQGADSRAGRTLGWGQTLGLGQTLGWGQTLGQGRLQGWGKYGFLKAYIPKLPNFSPLQLFHGLEEVPVVLQPGPDHLREVRQPHDRLSYSLYALHTKFQDSMASPWPRRGTCCPPSWP